MILNKINKYKGFVSVDEIEYKTKSGKTNKKELVVRKNAVAGLLYDTIRDSYIFVSQYRIGSNSDIVEIVAGLVDNPDENQRDTMVREAEEETGYEVDSMTLIDECYMSPGGSNEIITIYFCKVSHKVSEGGGLKSDGEEIDIIEMDRDEMLSTIFKDAKTIIAVNWVKYNFNI